MSYPWHLLVEAGSNNFAEMQSAYTAQADMVRKLVMPDYLSDYFQILLSFMVY